MLGASKTLKVRMEFLSNASSSDIPTEDVILALRLETNYVQVEEIEEDVVIEQGIGPLSLQKVWAGKNTFVAFENNNQRVTITQPIHFNAGDTITINGTDDVWFGLFLLYDDNGTWMIDTDCSNSKFGVGSWSNNKCDSGWINGNQDRTITIDRDTYVTMNFAFGTSRNITPTEDHMNIVRNLVTFTFNNSSNNNTSNDENQEEVDDSNVFGTYSNMTQKLLADSITINTFEKGKLVTIPSTLSNGAKIIPHVKLTASTVGGTDIKSAFTVANNGNYAAVMNAGLFNTSTKQPQGQTIIKGVSITNSPMTSDMGAAISANECYPLLISSNGYLSAASSRQVDTADLIASGAYYSVTGWMSIIDNGVKTSDNYDSVEIVHKGTYERQIIGQYQDGDYFMFTTTTTNKSGMTYDAIADILLSQSKSVRFAYSLDGGGSTESIIDKAFINHIFDNAPYGRSIPTVIYFDAVA